MVLRLQSVDTDYISLRQKLAMAMVSAVCLRNEEKEENALSKWIHTHIHGGHFWP
jgi:hypothetical protein